MSTPDDDALLAAVNAKLTRISIPEGRSKVAQHFSAGEADSAEISGVP